MGFKCGIIGLPNVGKSTLFNALTKTGAAQAANYPFCTIEPNIGEIDLPDKRLQSLAKLANSQKLIPTRLQFVDIAGLVKGAAQGEGLGNKFLANIREVDAIAHVVRCFDDGEVSHVHGQINPIDDIETIETELMLADIELLERRAESNLRKVKSGDKEARLLGKLIERLLASLVEGKPARLLERSVDEEKQINMLQLLTDKPSLYVANVDEEMIGQDGGDLANAVAKHAKSVGAQYVMISAAIEAEIVDLSDQDRRAFMDELGLKETGLDRMIRAGYSLLNLITFFTCGPKETRAWTIPDGTLAPAAAGVIHTDFERGFIRAECISYGDYIKYAGEQGAREAGCMRSEGKGYPVRDGDILHFRFNV